MKIPRTWAVAAFLGLALVGAATAGVVAHSTASTKTIKVSEREYHITLSTTKPAAGKTTFVIRNTGTISHGLDVKGPGVSKRVPLIRPGKSATLTVTLKAGTYSLWCPVPGHAALGMKAALKVKGAGTTPVSSTTAGTSTSGEAWG
jgi:uncharacterized cupredoxin-like copper-binding protein